VLRHVIHQLVNYPDIRDVDLDLRVQNIDSGVRFEKMSSAGEICGVSRFLLTTSN
jgi:hypothetical protein